MHKISQKFTKMHKNRPKASKDYANLRKSTSQKQRKSVSSREFVVLFCRTKPIDFVVRIA